MKSFAGRGFFSRTVSAGPPAPVYHPVATLDGAGGPAVVPIVMGLGVLSVPFVYAVPAGGGNIYRHIVAMVTTSILHSAALTFAFETAPAFGMNGLAFTGGAVQWLFFGEADIAGVNGSNWTLTRASSGGNPAVTYFARFYTFKDCDPSFTVFDSSSDIQLGVTPSPSLQGFGNMLAGSLKVAIGMRNNSVGGANTFRVSNPGDYSFSNAGSGGAGEQDTGDANIKTCLEYKITAAPESDPTDTWTFNAIQPAERAAIATLSFNGVTY